MMTFVRSLFAMGATPEGGSPWLQFLPFVLVLGIFYFIILLPMRRKQQKVAEVGPGMCAAGIAAARRIEGSIVLGVARVLDVEPTLARKELSVPGVSSGQYTIE